MKFLKWLGLGVLALAAVLLIGGWLLPSTFSVSRSVLVNAPADRIYPLVADPRGWTQWSVWNRRDSAMQIEYAGPPIGSGAQWTWHSKSQGDGRMTFTDVVPGQRVGYELFFPDFGTTSTGDLSFKPEGSATKVTWTMNGDMGHNPLFHWMALNADSMIGKDFEAGLANLKALAEKP